MGDDSTMKLGPVGIGSGNVWDEKGHNKIAQIFISHGADGINSIQFQYAEDGRLKLSQRHGNNNGYKFDAVMLKQATELITWIGGRVSKLNYGRLCSITFGTNLGEYGPFGSFKPNDEEEFRFNLGAQESQFAGFHGTLYSNCVISIGVYLKPTFALVDS